MIYALLAARAIVFVVLATTAFVVAYRHPELTLLAITAAVLVDDMAVP